MSNEIAVKKRRDFCSILCDRLPVQLMSFHTVVHVYIYIHMICVHIYIYTLYVYMYCNKDWYIYIYMYIQMIWYDYICIRPGVVLWVMNDQYKLGCLPLEKINATFSCHVESWLTMALHPYDLHHPLKVQVSMQWNVRICFGGPRCTVEKLRWFSFPVSIAHKMPRYIQRAIQT